MLSPALQQFGDKFLSLLTGTMTLVLIVTVHGLVLVRITTSYKRKLERVERAPRAGVRNTVLFGWTIYLLLTLHIFEIVIWSTLIYGLRVVPSTQDAIYVAANAYTTLGSGESLLGPGWRNLDPIMAISGLFTFAWTGSTLVTLASMIRQADSIHADAQKAAAVPQR